jgi:hypothetical protein
MRKFTSVLVVLLFILLAISTMVESRSLFPKNKESDYNLLDSFNILKSRSLLRLNTLKNLLSYFSLDDSSRLFDFTPEDITLKDDAFQGWRAYNTQ